MTSGPFPPRHQGLGGVPSVLPDVPANVVLLLAFAICGALHFTLFKHNMSKHQKKFAFNAATMGFCFTRIIATLLRIVWAYQPRNIHLAITAQIFVYAGVIILIGSNIWWSQRIIRAQHPLFGWTRLPSLTIPVLASISILTIIALVVAIVASFYIPTDAARLAARVTQQFAAVLFAMFAVAPIPILLISEIVKLHPSFRARTVDNFGNGSLDKKILVCLITAVFLSTGAIFRATVHFSPLVSLSAPTPWYLSKASFYVFNFTLEIFVVIFWLVVRVDKLYIIPDGSQGPHSYGNGTVFAGEDGNEKAPPSRTGERATQSKPAAISIATPRQSTLYVADTVIGTPASRKSVSSIPPVKRQDSWGSARKFMLTSPEIHQHATFARMTPPPPSITNSSRHSRALSRVDSAWGSEVASLRTLKYIPPPGVSALVESNVEAIKAPPAIRCTNCGSHGSPNNAEMGFDPISGKWVPRPTSLPSVTHYSVRETLRPVSTTVGRTSFEVEDWRNTRQQLRPASSVYTQTVGRCSHEV